MDTTTRRYEAVWSFTEHEHRDLVRGLNRVHDIACEVGHASALELRSDIRDVLQWVDDVLDPHIAWEEAWLYPRIDEVAGTPWATRSARFDHRQVRDMTERLRADLGRSEGTDSRDRLDQPRCHLFGLEALVRAHLEREERFLVPLLATGAPADVASPVPK